MSSMPSQLRQRTSRRNNGPRKLHEHRQRLPGSPLYPIYWLAGGSEEQRVHDNPSRGNCRAMETVKKFKSDFFTVSTALGKLSAYRSKFPTVPTASLAGFNNLKGLNKAAAQRLFFLEAAGKLSAAASSFPQLRQHHPKNATYHLRFCSNLRVQFQMRQQPSL